MSSKNQIISSLNFFLRNGNQKIEEFATEILQNQTTPLELSSILWTFLSLIKSNGPFGPDSLKLFYGLCFELTTQFPDLTSYLFLTFDRTDINKIGLKDSVQFIGYYAPSLKQTFQFTKYQLFEQNPEGFSNLVTALFQNPIPDLNPIIGRFSLDPDSIILFLFDFLSLQSDSKRYYPILKNFSIDHVISLLLYKLDKGFDAGLISLLFYFFDEGIIPQEQQWSIVNQLKGLLTNLKSNYSNAINLFCVELEKSKTYLPGEPKELQRTAIYKQREMEYRSAKEILYNSPHIQMMLQTININSIRKFSQIDPCSIPHVADYVTGFLLNELNSDPESFLENPLNIEMLTLLSCHCTDPQLVALICRLDNLPIHLYSNFILPSMCQMKDISWQLSNIIFSSLKKYSFKVRCQIYEKFSEACNQIPDMKLLSAHVKGRMSSISRRIAGDSAPKFSRKVAWQFMRAPHIVTKLYFSMVTDFNQPIPPKFLVLSLTDVSILSLDFLMWEFLKNIPTDRVPPWINNVGMFMALLAADQYISFDIVSYLIEIRDGLSKRSISHSRILASFITTLTNYEYKGNLTNSEIELRTGENLSRLLLRYNSLNENNETFVERSSYLTNILLGNNNLGLTILSLLDNMHDNLYLNDNFTNEINILDDLDNIKFTFLTVCEFISFDNLSPNDLIEQFSFSLPSAFHIVCDKTSDRCNAESLAPEGISKALFSYFWRYELKHFHVPKITFENLIESIKKKIDELSKNEDNNSICDYQLIEMQIESNKDKQENYVQSLQEEIITICDDWFSDFNSYELFVRYCIVPRSLLSQIDAIYSGIFINRMAHWCHSFSLIDFIRSVFKCLHFIIYSSTYEESRCFGFFVRKILSLVHNREEEIETHEILIQKVRLIFEKKSTFLNVVAFLSQIIKYFPLKTDHKRAILDLLEEIPEENMNRIRTYKDKLSTMLKTEYVSPIQEIEEVKTDENVNIESPKIEENATETEENTIEETKVESPNKNETENDNNNNAESNATDKEKEEKKTEEKKQQNESKKEQNVDKRIERRQHTEQRQSRYQSPRYPSRSYDPRRDDRQRMRRLDIDPRYGYYDDRYYDDRYYDDYRGSRR
ncbi:THO complex subunit 2 [Histomonas meleagridis]|uniref:THO complex subunit 2 n=1 Tax=Histomonas meleagridis TaxID=135588 RepID=UPI0035594E44|nr:THO complex subunit 2 [Histomonas meleagridis]KAH0800913.1 THO complex subunit 2 [Histomonas meleagridis]